MENCLKVYPKRGFLNTEYKIGSNSKETYTILFNGNKINEGVIEPGETKILPKLQFPGEYTIVCDRTNDRQIISVEDALRLGSSDLKKSYIFDEFPYIIFVMKDRIHFFDPVIQTYVFTENYLCPNNINHIKEGKLLFTTEHSSGISLSVFDTDVLSITETLEVNKIIAYSKDGTKLYILNKEKNSINIVNTEDLHIELEFQIEVLAEQHSYHLDEDNNLLYVVDKEHIYSIDLVSNCRQKFEKKNVIGITTKGFLISYKYGRYEYVDLKSCFVNNNGSFLYNTLFPILRFNGFYIKNTDWENRYNSRKENISYSDLCEDFEKECRGRIANGDLSDKFSKKVDWNSIIVTVDFSPTKEGVYIIEEIEHIQETVMCFYKNSNRVSRPVVDRRIRVVWVSNQGYEVCYTKKGISGKDIKIEGETAIFPATSSLYFMLKNGELISTYSNEEVIKFYKSSFEEKKAELLIEGEIVSTDKIICRSANKLIYKHFDSYGFYELSDNLEWIKKNTIVLVEEKHTRAKMSSDGKYLVYSKGGNKYALYNISEQKEETVLTGNFVDFDKSGNLLFMEDSHGRPANYRELKIYNPISFQWEKSNSHYYTFVSPDGKLYAKTALRNFYFNKLTNKEITREEFIEFSKEYDTSIYKKYTEEQKEDLMAKRTTFVNQHKSFFETYQKDKSYSKAWIDNIINIDYTNFSSVFLCIKHAVVIGIVNSNKELEIELSQPLSFLNYVAFSYDNKYVGIVGKPGNNGYLKLVKINFDEDSNSLSLEKEICDTEIAKWATWICAFTKLGLFGTYDSSPDLYLINQSDFDKFNSENTNDFNFIKTHFRIPDRSLLCFSPSGKLMALSNQGYEPKSLGGVGHVPSNDVYIYDTESCKEFVHWNDQGDRIAFRNVANAGFSVDESRFMTVSLDGVIVVRNIREHIEIEDCKKKSNILSIA